MMRLKCAFRNLVINIVARQMAEFQAIIPMLRGAKVTLYVFLGCRVCSAQQPSSMIKIVSSGLPSTERETTRIRSVVGCALAPYLVCSKDTGLS